jgi:hypothetical protein
LDIINFCRRNSRYRNNIVIGKVRDLRNIYMGGGHVEIQTSYKILKLILYWLIKKQQIYGRI